MILKSTLQSTVILSVHVPVNHHIRVDGVLLEYIIFSLCLISKKKSINCSILSVAKQSLRTADLDGIYLTAYNNIIHIIIILICFMIMALPAILQLFCFIAGRNFIIGGYAIFYTIKKK